MSTDTRTVKDPVSHAPEGRFEGGSTASDKWSTITKIDVSSLQLDDSFDGDGDPYNSTGRFLAAAIKQRVRD
jgi:hypothetical protein